ncbi:ecto-ADP-ribosyltransferase 5-like [Bufo bufo]|uniref:ecto-ADP-ribosyltransferase 5-like n=1 Tax=Bufo bufo TaxID=8384 RepID=UPI001ABE631D|nr:ecto-ADP-ribosyltransferase 5-like [Bufo bufo]
MDQWSIFLLMLLTFHMKMDLAQEIQLSDNPEMFDDQYKGCRLKMDKIIPSILKSENASNVEFRNDWLQAAEYWETIKLDIKKLPKGFRNEHGIALVAYTSNMYKAFNKATRDVGKLIQNYKKNFNFKAMHYYLTTAMRLLSNKVNKLVYRGVRNIQFIPSNNSKGGIRFGQFISTSADKATATYFGNSSFFTIKTRLGVDIQRFSLYPSEKEVLIPGYEIFKLLSFNKETHSFRLISKGLSKSRFNCAYFKSI